MGHSSAISNTSLEELEVEKLSNGRQKKTRNAKTIADKKKAQVTSMKGRCSVHSPSRRTYTNLKDIDLLRFLFVEDGFSARIEKFYLGFNCLLCLASW